MTAFKARNYLFIRMTGWKCSLRMHEPLNYPVLIIFDKLLLVVRISYDLNRFSNDLKWIFRDFYRILLVYNSTKMWTQKNWEVLPERSVLLLVGGFDSISSNHRTVFCSVSSILKRSLSRNPFLTSKRYFDLSNLNLIFPTSKFRIF